MKNIIDTLKKIWGIEELRKRIIYTLLLLAAYRIGSYIVLPGLNAAALEQYQAGSQSGSGLFGLVNAFTGGAFTNAAILALGIMPYISASIVIQLLGFAVPYFQRLQREGESGRKKQTQITRWLTVLITLVQSSAYLTYIRTTYPNAIDDSVVSQPTFWIVNVLVLTAGTVFSMWLGERITEKGLGNGTSLLIMSGIISRLPSSFAAEFEFRSGGSGGGMVAFVLELAFLVVVIGITILLVQAIRRIPIQYAKRMVGRQQTTTNSVAFGGERDNLPIKVNSAGVMPIIFAQALMFLPIVLLQFISKDAADSLQNFSKFTSLSYNLVFFLLIFVFTYVYTALVVNSKQYADFLKSQNAFIPGVQPGQDTANYIDAVTSHITLPGAIALGLVAILPAFVAAFGVNEQFALFFGGSSLIIMVGVILDTVQQVEGHLLMQRYDGLVKSGNTGRETVDVEEVVVEK